MRGHQIRVLAALDEFGPISQADLGRTAELDKGDVARAVDDLELARLVRRQADPADSRRKLVSITQRGRRRRGDVEHALAVVQREVLAPLASDEQETLIRLLGRLQP